MCAKEVLTKKRVANALGVFEKLRVQVSHGSILSISTLLLIIFIAFAIRILPMRWEIPGGTLNLGEFDSYYYYSATQYMVQHGLLSPFLPKAWFNFQLSYPFGYDMGDLILPTLPTVAAVSYDVVTFLGVHIDLMSFCSVFAALLGTLTVLFLYFVGKDFGGKAVGLLSALFLALLPSVIERTGLGWFETEPVGLLGFVVFILFFFRAIDPNRSGRSTILYSIGAGLAIAFFTGGWGAAYFVFGVAAIFILVLVLLKRQNHRLLFSFSITFGLGLFLTTLIPYFSTAYLLTAPVLAVAAVFALLVFFGSLAFCRFSQGKNNCVCRLDCPVSCCLCFPVDQRDFHTYCRQVFFCNRPVCSQFKSDTRLSSRASSHIVG